MKSKLLDLSKVKKLYGHENPFLLKIYKKWQPFPPRGKVTDKLYKRTILEIFNQFGKKEFL